MNIGNQSRATATDDVGRYHVGPVPRALAASTLAASGQRVLLCPRREGYIMRNNVQDESAG